MINNVSLTGRLTRDPELKYTGSGTAATNFNLAVNRTFKSANGERETDFIMCQAWRKTAEIIANNLNKGSLIGVEGRIQTRNYQDSDGKTVYITEVVVATVIIGILPTLLLITSFYTAYKAKLAVKTREKVEE